VARKAGEKGAIIAHAHDHHHISNEGRNADGTFQKGSEAAKEAGHIGGILSHAHVHDKPAESK
jgi:hypothetical protein